MSDEIINRVANSALEVFDLEDYYTKGVRVEIDLAQWLWEGFVLKEKEFRTALNEYDWSQHQDQLVALKCSTDAIIPAWAYVLVTTFLSPFTAKIVQGNLEDLETALYQEVLPKIDYSIYQDKPVILKGCSKKPVPMSAYLMAVQEIQKYAKSIMYGEACSAVPLYKAKK
ncbi:DUF2480 family protein [Flavobacterium sp. CYK-55]|uniref:DUF2480 family protein n=1 Tax=Flavobacterium sp. CYK-55 TaxID=2835529 RepID=UPI001BD06CD7|nr:DUF2480 family protein [Flavobacterium sp. CYK-55]MBS7786117.1 DUF2480 family protein [Flavobacterium sp. CYK-55]